MVLLIGSRFALFAASEIKRKESDIFKSITVEILGYDLYFKLEQGKKVKILLHQDSIEELQPYLDIEKTGGYMGKMIDAGIGIFCDKKHLGERGEECFINKKRDASSKQNKTC